MTDDAPKSAYELAMERLRKKEQDSGGDERALTDALRRQARHEETTRWDSIEFKLD